MDTYKGVFHTFIAYKLKDRCKPYSNILKRKEAKEILRIHNIPASIYEKFLKEMEEFKLIKIRDKQNIEIRMNGIYKDPNIVTIEKLHKEHKTQKEIAEELEISQVMVSKIMSRNNIK